MTSETPDRKSFDGDGRHAVLLGHGGEEVHHIAGKATKLHLTILENGVIYLGRKAVINQSAVSERAAGDLCPVYKQRLAYDDLVGVFHIASARIEKLNISSRTCESTHPN